MKVKFWKGDISNKSISYLPRTYSLRQRIYHYGNKKYSHIIEFPDGKIIYYPVGQDAKVLTFVDMKLLHFNDKNS